MQKTIHEIRLLLEAAQKDAAATQETLMQNPRYVELRTFVDNLTGKNLEQELETNRWAHDNPDACMAKVYELRSLEGSLRAQRGFVKHLDWELRQALEDEAEEAAL